MLPADLIREIRRIEIHTGRLVQAELGGAYHSVFRGRGIAFSEVRPYQFGDDVRAIDWNVTARLGQPHVKLFVEERELTVLLLVDASASLLFGTREPLKRGLAARVAAVLAFSAIRNNDRVGLVAFTDRVEKFVPPAMGRRHVLRVIREVLAFSPGGRATSLRAALEFAGRVQRRRAVVFVISDFLDAGYEHALRVAARRHDVVPVIVGDPLEETVVPLGLWQVRDPESGALACFDTLGPEARAFAALVHRRRQELARLLSRLGLDAIHARTDRPYARALVEFFAARARRFRR